VSGHAAARTVGTAAHAAEHAPPFPAAATVGGDGVHRRLAPVLGGAAAACAGRAHAAALRRGGCGRPDVAGAHAALRDVAGHRRAPLSGTALSTNASPARCPRIPRT